MKPIYKAAIAFVVVSLMLMLSLVFIAPGTAALIPNEYRDPSLNTLTRLGTTHVFAPGTLEFNPTNGTVYSISPYAFGHVLGTLYRQDVYISPSETGAGTVAAVAANATFKLDVSYPNGTTYDSGNITVGTANWTLVGGPAWAVGVEFPYWFQLPTNSSEVGGDYTFRIFAWISGKCVGMMTWTYHIPFSLSAGNQFDSVEIYNHASLIHSFKDNATSYAGGQNTSITRLLATVHLEASTGSSGAAVSAWTRVYFTVVSNETGEVFSGAATVKQSPFTYINSLMRWEGVLYVNMNGPLPAGNYTYVAQLYLNNTLQDTWTVYFNVPGEELGSFTLFNNLLRWGAGFGSVLGLLFVPAVGAWMYRTGKEGHEVMAFMIVGCTLFGIFAYVFFLGGT